MKREEYLKSAFDKFNSGKISAEALDDDLEKEILVQDSDEYKTDCRYYVYDRKDNVISDGFCFVEDARAFLNNHDDACFIKVHNYFRDECDKLHPEGDPEIVDVSDFVKTVYEKYKEDWCRHRGVKLDEEVGIFGECYVCLSEFVNNELQDIEYMKSLLSAEDFIKLETSLNEPSGCEPLQTLSEKIAMAESKKESAAVNEKPKEFEVTITETLKMKVTIEADSLEEAEQLVSDSWHKGDYVLDADNFVGVEFDGKVVAEKTKDLIER